MCFLVVSIYNLKMLEKIETLSPNLLSFVVARMCSTIDSGEKGYTLLGQILFNFLALFPTLYWWFVCVFYDGCTRMLNQKLF